MTTQPPSYPRHRFPAEIISHAVWLYHVFSLSLRDVELILAERGITVTHESIRQWGYGSGPTSPAGYPRRGPPPAGYAGVGLSPVILGTSMRCSCGSTVCCTTSGAQLTSMASCSTSSCRA